jgi:hypothetical protein
MVLVYIIYKQSCSFFTYDRLITCIKWAIFVTKIKSKALEFPRSVMKSTNTEIQGFFGIDNRRNSPYGR